MENQPSTSVQPRGGNQKLIIGIIVVVVICCCCAAAAAGGYYAWQAYQTAQTSINQFQQYDPSTSIPDNSNNSQPEIQVPASSGELPSGGLTDDLLRRDVWAIISGASTGLGCDPNGPQSSIEVTQSPDSVGIWTETWTVACNSGGTQAFTVDFVPDPNGGTNYNITQIK